MSNKIVVHKNRTNTLRLNLGIDVSDDDEMPSSEIRSEARVDSPLLATWTVTYDTDGVDGKLILVIDDLDAAQIAANSGYMDVKRVLAGEPIAVFDQPLEVAFRGVVTE